MRVGNRPDSKAFDTTRLEHSRVLSRPGSSCPPVVPYPFKTLIHEAGLGEHGHTTEAPSVHRGTAEFQAESTAYLVLHDLGEGRLDGCLSQPCQRADVATRGAAER